MTRYVNNVYIYSCEIKGLKEIKPGTMSSDVECGKSVPIPLIVGVVVGVSVGVLLTAVGIKIYHKFKQKRQASDRSKTVLITKIYV